MEETHGNTFYTEDSHSTFIPSHVLQSYPVHSSCEAWELQADIDHWYCAYITPFVWEKYNIITSPVTYLISPVIYHTKPYLWHWLLKGNKVMLQSLLHSAHSKVLKKWKEVKKWKVFLKFLSRLSCFFTEVLEEIKDKYQAGVLSPKSCQAHIRQVYLILSAEDSDSLSFTPTFNETASPSSPSNFVITLYCCASQIALRGSNLF